MFDQEMKLCATLLCILCLSSTCLMYIPLSDNGLELQVRTHAVPEGGTAILVCNITSAYNGSYSYQDISFCMNYCNDSTSYDDDVTYMPPSSAVLTLTDVRISTLNKYSHWHCRLPDRTDRSPTAMSSLIVCKNPLKPNITNCIIYNWTAVECLWEPYWSWQVEYMEVTVDNYHEALYWRHFSSREWTDTGACLDTSETQPCEWNVNVLTPLSFTDTYCFLVNVTYCFKQASVLSSDLCVRLSDIIKVGQPENLQWTVNASVAVIDWQPPALKQYTSLLYDVMINSQQHSEHITSISHTSVTVMVNAFTWYNVSVRAKPVESLVWSEETFIEFQSQPAVARRSPSLFTSALTIVNNDSGNRSVTIYWKSLRQSECQALLCWYEVVSPTSSWQPNGTKVPFNATSASLLVDMNRLELSVITCSQLGCTDPVDILYVPASSSIASSSASELIVEGVNRTAVCHWKSQSLVTLYWCLSEGSHGICKSELNWTDIKPSVTEYNLSLAFRFDLYTFGVATNTGTNIIMWTQCLHNLTAFAPAPKIKVFALGVGQLLLKWQRPVCQSSHGYIQSFDIAYCQLLENKSCHGMPSHVLVAGDLKEHKLTGLNDNIEYSVWMYSVTRAGLSAASNNVTAMTRGSVMSVTVISILAIVLCVFIFLAAIVIRVYYRKCQRCCKNYTSGLAIKVPVDDSVQSSARRSVYDAMLQYSRIVYGRQTSRLSNSSRDSGHFCITVSPSLSPDNTSVTWPLISPDGAGGSYVDRLRFGNGVNYVNREVCATGAGDFGCYDALLAPCERHELSVLQVSPVQNELTHGVDRERTVSEESRTDSDRDSGYIRHDDWMNTLSTVTHLETRTSTSSA